MHQDAKTQPENSEDMPIVDANLSVASGTNLTFVVPESQLDIIERDGIVTFVNRKDPEDILSKRLEESSNSGYTGYKVSVLLNVSQEAVFNLVIDERSGDNLLVEGAADLRHRVRPHQPPLRGRAEQVGSGERRTAF